MKIEKAKVRYSSKVEIRDTGSTRPSVFTEKYRGEYFNIEVDKLFAFKKQARKNFNIEALEQLSETIKAYGVRQPLTVIPIENEPGKYEVVSGERRLRASIMAGLKTVPCIIIYDKKTATEISLIENIQREDLHSLELAQAYQQLLDEKICSSQSEIAEKLGLSKSSVSETMKLLTLPLLVKEYILTNNINSRSLFREISDLSNVDEIMKILKSPLKVDSKINKKSKNTVLLKVILSGNKVLIDTNSLSKLSEQRRIQLKNDLFSII